MDTATTRDIGTRIWPTRSFCRSSTRLIMARSSLVRLWADSCMIWRSSSRLPKRAAGKALAAGPVKQAAGEQGHEGDQGLEHQVNAPERQGHGHAEPIRMELKDHFGQQLAQSVKQQDRGAQGADQQGGPAPEPKIGLHDADAENGDIGQGIAHQNGQQKILRIFEVFVEHPGPAIAGAHQAPHAEPVQRKHARFHTRHHERDEQAEQQE